MEFQFIFISAHEGKHGATMSEVKCEVDMLVVEAIGHPRRSTILIIQDMELVEVLRLRSYRRSEEFKKNRRDHLYQDQKRSMTVV